MAIQLTHEAADHVKSLLAKRSQALGMRIATKKSGCTGFAYEVDYVEEIMPDDEVFESHGVKVVVDKESLPMLDGMKVDFVKSSLLNEGLEFINPNVKEMCGCGESFSV
jgi:iron-sulfur cluster assembly protein